MVTGIILRAIKNNLQTKRSALNGTPQYHYLFLFFLSKGENSFANDLNTPYCCVIKLPAVLDFLYIE